jgi:ribonuclease J
MGVQREIEIGLQRRLRRELQVEPLIICLVQPAPGGTPAYKGRADSEPDTRPAPRGGRGGGRDVQRGERPERVERSQQPRRELAAVGAAAAPAPAAAAAAPVATPARVEEPEISGRTRRRRSAAAG